VPESVFEGITVIELGGTTAAMLAGLLLADNGARVVHVEPPEGARAREAVKSQFLVFNRGKESLVADLHTLAGQVTAREWILRADVVIEAFETGQAAAFNIGYEQLAELNPRLVYCSIKGFGSTGPYARIPGYEHVVQAKTGFLNLGTGGLFGYRPGPIFINAPMASTGAGFNAAAGIAAALRVREATGKGQWLETTLVQGLDPTDYFGTVLWQFEHRKLPAPNSPIFAASSAQGGSAKPASAGSIAANRYAFMLCTKDARWVTFTAMLRHQTEAILRALGLTSLLEEARFSTAPLFESAEVAEEFEEAIRERFRTKTYSEWDPVLAAEEDISYELARTSEEGLDHPQVRANGEVIEVNDAEVGTIEEVGPLIRFARTPSRVRGSAPRLDQHDSLPPEHRQESSGGDLPRHPLSGTTILEFGYFYAMPYGTALAASLGARVIKIEDLKGDPMRFAFGPPEAGAMKAMGGKESISVDLRTPNGREVVHRLVRSADVFVNGFRPGVAERVGLDYETLRAINPGITYLHAAGYGESGPYAKRPIYAQSASVIAGSQHRQSATWMDPALSEDFSVPEVYAVIQPRLRSQVDGDSNAALGVFVALCFALFDRAKSGTGQALCTSMVGSNLWGYLDDAVRYAGKPPLRQTDPEFYGLNALYRLYETRDGWVFLAAPTESAWHSLAVALGLSELEADERFATSAAREANDDALATLLEQAFAAGDAASFEKTLGSAGVACVKTSDSTVSAFTNTDPVLRETGLVCDVEHPLYGTTTRSGVPVQFTLTPGIVAAGPLVGQQTTAILREIGYGDAEVAKLHEAGVVRTAR
jgi:crotonobetainyl-CoA:carnitine CoA-transferase CaiB-like acyl-CoA transferase